MLTKQEILLARGARTESGRVKEPRAALVSRLAVLGLWYGLVSGLSLASLSDSESLLWGTHCSTKVGCQYDSGRRSTRGTSFDLF